MDSENFSKVIHYRVIHLKTVIKKVHSCAQGDHREKERVLPCSLIAAIFCVKNSTF
tara:strand:- start:531 stop:698 length:168 start_codon:yes stop_codon:yes gene_type:complete